MIWRARVAAFARVTWIPRSETSRRARALSHLFGGLLGDAGDARHARQVSTTSCRVLPVTVIRKRHVLVELGALLPVERARFASRAVQHHKADVAHAIRLCVAPRGRSLVNGARCTHFGAFEICVRVRGTRLAHRRTAGCRVRANWTLDATLLIWNVCRVEVTRWT